MSHETIAEYLNRVGQMLNALEADPALAQPFDRFPTNAQWRAETRDLYNELTTAVNTQVTEKADQLAATQAYHQAREKADTAYTDTLQVARVAFRNDEQAQIDLELNGRRARSQSAWLRQLQGFYQRLLNDPDKLAQMKLYGYPAELLQEEAQLVQQADQAKATQNREMGEAQAATKDRDQKLDQLDQRIQQLEGLAPVALKAHPQWQEKLGIIEPS